MECRHKMSGLSAGLLFACMLLPPDAYGAGWAVGVGGGYADEFHYRTYSFFGDRDEGRINGTGFPLLSALSNAGGRFGVTAQAAFLPYAFGDRFIRTDHIPVSVGVRYRIKPEPKFDASPYIEVSPALVWSNWRGTDYYEGGGKAVKPGLVAGVGVQGRATGKVGVDFGARYFLSADAKVIHRGGSPDVTQTLEGLSQIGFLFGLYYRP